MYARKTHVFGLAFGIFDDDCYWNERFSSFFIWFVKLLDGIFCVLRRKNDENISVVSFWKQQIIIEQTTERLPPRRLRSSNSNLNKKRPKCE